MSLLPASVTSGPNNPDDFYFALAGSVGGPQVLAQSGNTVSLTGGGGAVNISTTTAVATSTQKLTGTSYVAGIQSTQFAGQVIVDGGASGLSRLTGGTVEITRDLVNPRIVMSRDDILGQGIIEYDGSGSRFVMPSVELREQVYDSTGNAGVSGELLISQGAGAPWIWSSAGGATGATGPQGVPGLTSTFFDYKAKTTITSGDPLNTHIIWDNATQTASTQINVSNIDRNGEDISVFLGLLGIGDEIILQDTSVGTNFQKWEITSATQQVGYFEYGVTLISGSYSFGNNDDMLLIIFYQGPVGPTGDVGPTGPQGITGPTGPAPVQNLEQTLSVGNSAGIYNIDMNQKEVQNVSFFTLRDDIDDIPTVAFTKTGVQKAFIEYNGNGTNDRLTLSGTTLVLDAAAGNLELDAALGARLQSQGVPIKILRETAAPAADTIMTFNAAGEVQIGVDGLATSPALAFRGNLGNTFIMTFDDASNNLVATGLMRFPSTLPKSAVVPAAADDLVNKAYVDANVPTWTTFSPAILQGGSLTFTTNYAKYFKFGKMVHAQMLLSGFSGATDGSEIEVLFNDLPAAPNIEYTGNFFLVDSGNTVYSGSIVPTSTTSCSLYVYGNGDPIAIGLGVGLGASDTLRLSLFYESA